MGSVGEIVFSGPLLAALPLALAAGFLAFASPCVLPLVPGYLGYVSGFRGGVETKRPTRRLVIGVLLFIAGFSTVFISFSIAFASLGALLIGWFDVILRVAGLLVILMGFVFIGQVSFLQRAVTLPLAGTSGLVGAPFLGMVFGLGWTPCIGPTLVAINTLALTVGDVPRAVILATAYCLGLGVPFLLIALGFSWVTGGVSWLKRHIRAINITGGVMLMAIGAAMVSGVWQMWMSSLQAVIGGTTTPL
ncbi:cytochrome c biogenesis protein CcdA [Pontimonas sp.]|jgi:cytochrome c-type biogenesis protein|nr:cytochrome c biogenesis protein CcdA [Pontimonas sp.]|tara:strand:+ start:1020 stop:1763 length:744 start_codon:yes stop_codon:yes gene_type:complete